MFVSNFYFFVAKCLEWSKKNVTTRGVTRGGKGDTIPRAPIHYGCAGLLLEAPKSPNNVTSTFFKTVNLPSKELRFDQGGAEFVFVPGAI